VKRKSVKQKRNRSSHINWSHVLLDLIRLAKLPEPQQEYTFHAHRQWRFDFCWKQPLVACEIEGGIWMKTETGYSKGHAHPERFEKDCEKYNEAALYGWTVIRVTPKMISDGRAIDWLERALLD
jgi:very-short-patch-repair endonuclease